MKTRVVAVLSLFLLLAASAAAQEDAGAAQEDRAARPEARDPCVVAAEEQAAGDDAQGADANGTDNGTAENATHEAGTAAGGDDTREHDNATQDEDGGRADDASRADARRAPPAPSEAEAACAEQQRQRDELAVAYCRQHPDDARCAELRERLDAFCEERPRAPVCQEVPPPPGPGHTAAFAACQRALPPNASLEARARHTEMCCDTFGGNNDEVRRLCDFQDAVHEALIEGRHVAFEPTADGLGLQNYTVDGRRVLDALAYLPQDPDVPVSAERVGSRLEVQIGTEGAIAIIDNPTGLVSGRGMGSFDLRLPANATLEQLEEGWRVKGDGWQAILLARDLERDGQDVTAHGFISYHVKPDAPARRSASLPAETIERAAAKGHLGAEVSIRRHDPARPNGVDVLQYGDVQVEVELPEHAATTENPIRVEVSAELEEGRTIVLDLDPALLSSSAPDQLELRYYDVTYANGTRHAEEVAFAPASGLDDVMDPTDDDGQAEYWVVSDANGVHVLVSVPHWSIHAITVASIVEALQQPSVLAGAIAGAAGAVIAAVMLLRPRRDDET